MVRHVVMVAYTAWGHLRPESALAVTLVRRFEDVVISFIVDCDLADRALEEMKRQCTTPAENATLPPRIRVMSAARVVEGFLLARKLLGKVLKDEPLFDDAGEEWHSVGALPRTVIGDVVMGDLLMPVKEDHPFQLFLWWGGNASSFTRMFGPPDRGGRGGYAEECRKTYEDEKRGDGRSFGDITRDIAIRSSRFPNNIIPVAGLPPYYQWEDWPQEVWHPSLYDALCKCQKLMELADGVLLGTVVDLEPESVKDVMQYMHPKQVLCLGPQFGLAAPSSQGNDLAIKFLDSALVKHGAQSALYISFGSAFFPPAEHVRVLVETLLELDDPMPFVFTASRRRLNPQLMQSIEASGRGLVVSWAPQQAILAHPALGWMISHCGAGGMFESLAEGVPVIAWPFTADQPQHALWLSEVLDSAFELLQIRTGVAQQMKALRGGPEGTTILGTEDAIKQELVDVLTQARGQLGVRKRHNATAAREKLLHAEEAAGSVKKALDELGVELGR